MSRCSGNSEQATNAIDPSVAFGSEGKTTYLSSLGNYYIEMPPPAEPLFIGGAIQANRSLDGGRTWSNVVVVDSHVPPGNDIPVVVSDPNTENNAYIVYADIPQGIFLARTTDGGVTWTNSDLPIAPPGFPQLIVRRSNSMEMVLVFSVTGPTPDPPQPPPPTRVFTTRSTDGGSTWSVPAELAALPSKTFPRAGEAPDGTIYITWWNGGDVEIVHSVDVLPDSNISWSPPETVSTAGGTQSTVPLPGPTVAIDPSGTVGVLWEDRRHATVAAPTLTDVWFAYSQDGTAPWPERHVAGPFAPRPVAIIEGEATDGAYMALVPVSDGFGAAFVQTFNQPDNLADVYYTHISHRSADLSFTKTGPPGRVPSVSSPTPDSNLGNNTDSEDTSICRITSRRSSIPCG